MALASSGDTEARREVVVRLMGRVQRLTRGLLKGRTEAEDAAQNSLLQILRSAATYEGRSSLETWADRITVRTSLRLAQRSRREPTEPWEESGVEEVPDASGEHESDDEDFEKRLAESLEVLPPNQREVIVMRHMLGYSIDEMAEASGLSRNTIKDRLLRAREKLRERVKRRWRASALLRKEAS